MNIQVCNSFSDAVVLYLPQQLFLKPVSKINISIQLPSCKALGKTISNWELMERMREMIRPDLFSSLKVAKSTSDTIRFEGELDDRKRIQGVVSCLDERSIKLNGYPEPLKLKASEAKLDFPSRHSWDSFFRDAPNMDEMKPGERPDTIHISNLPIKWFVNSRDLQDEDAKPSENIFRRVFEKFGKVRCVDIPICDPYRKQMKPHMTGISKFSFDSELYFEGYVQFSEYMGFVRAMDAFRGMKLLKKEEDSVGQAVTIDVNFDKTKHLCEATIKRRSIVRERLVAQERTREEKEKEESLKNQKKEEAERRKRDQSEREKLTHMQEREERRKAKQLAKLKTQEASEINSKIAEEQKKLLRTQRKLQSIRLIEELFRRIQLKQKHISLYKKDDLHTNHSNQNHKDKKKELKRLEKALLLESKEKMVRDRLVSKYKSAQEQELEEQRQNLRKAIEGNIVLRSVLDTGKKKARTPSISSLSSGSDISIEELTSRKIKTERLTTPERNQLIPKEEDGMVRGYPPTYSYGPYGPYVNHSYNYHQPPPGPFYPRAAYYPLPAEGAYGRGRGYAMRRPRGPRGGYRGMPRMPFFDGPNAHHAYYKYFKKLTEESGDRTNRDHSYSRSRSRSRRRSYTRSRSRSYSRSRSRRRSSSRHRSRYSRSRSRSPRSRSRNRRSRTRSRSRSRHSRHTRSRSHNKSRTRSRSHSRHRRSRSRHSRDSKSRNRSPAEEKQLKATDNSEKQRSESMGKKKSSKQSSKSPVNKHGEQDKEDTSILRRRRSKSWSLPRNSAKKAKSWSKSPPLELHKNNL